MNETDLPQRLERAASTIEVSAAPLDAVMTRGRRRRRRRAAAQSALGMGTVAAVVWVGTVLAPGPAEPQPPTTVAVSPTASETSKQPPVLWAPDSRLFGRGTAVFMLPDGWGVNELHCGTPVEDTVITPRTGSTCLAYIPRPQVHTVEVVPGRPTHGHAFGRYDPTTVDGVAAEITPIRCWQHQTKQLCRRALHVPSSDVTFVAEGWTEDLLDELLARVHILEDRVVVPYADDEDVVETLTAAGVEIRTLEHLAYGTPAGTVLTVSPAPGTIVAAGDVVTLTVARPPGPADDPHVTWRSIGDDSSSTVAEADIRRHTRIASRVGHTIELTSEGGTLDGVTARLEGTSVVPADDSKRPSTFLVEHRGTTIMTIYTVEDGVETEIGEVIVYAP